MVPNTKSSDEESEELEEAEEFDQIESVDGIEIFENEELHHDIKPSFMGLVSEHGFLRSTLSLGLTPYLKQKNTRYIVTNKRLIDKQGGLFSNETEEIQFDDIVGDIQTHQGPLEGIVNSGTIQFKIEKQMRTGSTQHESTTREGSRNRMDIERRDIELNGVKDHQQVTNTIRRIAHT